MKSFKEIYTETKINHVMIFLILIGSLNWGAVAHGSNLVELLSDYLNNFYKLPYDKILYLLITFSAINLMMKRDFWLPFLGNSVLPPNLVPLRENQKYDTEIKVCVPKGSKVAYWAAIPHKETPDVISAYDKYQNSGVVMANKDGIATLKVMKGTGYIVPSGRYIKPHLHYRVIDNEYGMMGPVYKVDY